MTAWRKLNFNDAVIAPSLAYESLGAWPCTTTQDQHPRRNTAAADTRHPRLVQRPCLHRLPLPRRRTLQFFPPASPRAWHALHPERLLILSQICCRAQFWAKLARALNCPPTHSLVHVNGSVVVVVMAVVANSSVPYLHFPNRAV